MLLTITLIIIGGVVVAVNGYDLGNLPKDSKLVGNALPKRPVILDVKWPADQGKPTVTRA